MLVTGPIFSGLEDIFGFPILSFGTPSHSVVSNQHLGTLPDLGKLWL